MAVAVLVIAVTEDTGRQRTAIHEAGHLVVAHALGCQIHGLTVEQGAVRHGCARYTQAPAGAPVPDAGLPLAAWPVEWRRWAETRVMIYLAGYRAAEMFTPRTGRIGPTLAEKAVELAAELAADPLPPALPAERETLAAGTGDETLPTDADEVARVVRLVHGEVTARSEAWLRWLDEELYALLRWREPRVRRLAAAALKLGTVGAEAAARLLEQS